jgi:hypothetical protein
MDPKPRFWRHQVSARVDTASFDRNRQKACSGSSTLIRWIFGSFRIRGLCKKQALGEEPTRRHSRDDLLVCFYTKRRRLTFQVW